MKILLLGKDGQLGRELQRALRPIADVTALGRRVEQGRCGDLTKLDLLLNTIRDLRPDVVVNAAAYTAVDRAEIDQGTLHQVNTLAPAAIAAELSLTDALFVHYSSDYVFDGVEAKWQSEQSTTVPLNAYGRSKLAGELSIRQAGCRHLIFRTSWMYSVHRENFAIRVLRQVSRGNPIRVVDDQIGTPTAAQLVADVSARVIQSVQVGYSKGRRAFPCETVRQEGTYHLVAAGMTSRFGYARYLVQCASRRNLLSDTAAQLVIAMKSADEPAAALRPAHSLLATEKITQHFGVQMPMWETDVEQFVTQLDAYPSRTYLKFV